jgi:hypothetical protein
MVRAILVAAFVVPALAVRRRYPPGMDVPLAKLIDVDDAIELDLPCPWCRFPTAETDDCCSGCGKRFGA